MRYDLQVILHLNAAATQEVSLYTTSPILDEEKTDIVATSTVLVSKGQCPRAQVCKDIILSSLVHHPFNISCCLIDVNTVKFEKKRNLKIKTTI